MTPTAAIRPLEPVREQDRAELLLHPLRREVLRLARRPASASDMARVLDLPAQKVNYHVRTLADAGFLVLDEERRKGNLVERRYRSSARAYLLLPEVLGELGPGRLPPGDAVSASRLLALSATLQSELAESWERAEGEGRRLPTLSVDAELRFRSEDERAAFAGALREAVTQVVGRFASPERGPGGEAGEGDPYRLVIGCYPRGAAAAGDDGHETDDARLDEEVER